MTDLKQLAAEIESKCLQVNRKMAHHSMTGEIGAVIFRRTVCVELLEALVKKVRADVADELGKPYPEDIFKPLTDDELMRIVDKLTTIGVPAASDRLHASWARHWSGALKSGKQ